MALWRHIYPDTSCSSGILVSGYMTIWCKRGLRLGDVLTCTGLCVCVCVRASIECATGAYSAHQDVITQSIPGEQAQVRGPAAHAADNAARRRWRQLQQWRHVSTSTSSSARVSWTHHGTSYCDGPSWRGHGWPVSITRQHVPCWRARVSTIRVDEQCLHFYRRCYYYYYYYYIPLG